jgi:hypothetical protein
MTDYLSVSQYAALHRMDTGNIRRRILDGQIPAEKVGNQWIIKSSTPPPADRRVKSGKYKGYLENRGAAN